MVVRRNEDVTTQHSSPVPAMIDFCNRVGLDEVLVLVADVLDYTRKVLLNRVGVLRSAAKLEPVAQRGTSFGQIGAQRDVYLVQDVIVEVILVRSDPGFFEWIYAQSHDQGLRSVVVLVDECIYIGGVGRWIENGQRGILVAGGKYRTSSQGKRGSRDCDCQLVTVRFHCWFSLVDGWVVSKFLLPEVRTGFGAV